MHSIATPASRRPAARSTSSPGALSSRPGDIAAGAGSPEAVDLDRSQPRCAATTGSQLRCSARLRTVSGSGQYGGVATVAGPGLADFSEATRSWFTSAFAEPTPAQAQAWSAIGNGDHTLVIAPTGSGKTLAAF